MKNATRAFAQRIARKPWGTLLVILALAAVASAAFVIRRTHAAGLRSGTASAASAIQQGPSTRLVSAPQGPTTFNPVVTTSVANGISPVVRDLPVTKNLSGFAEWRYYGYGEAFYLYEGFRTHLVTAGLRFTR